MPISCIKLIISLSLKRSKNANEIYEYISKSSDPYPISKNHILQILTTMRKLISKYYKNVYKLELIADENGQDSISVDESLFVHDEGNQILVIGLINNPTKEIRLSIAKGRRSETIKKIITENIPKGNIIIIDSALYYSWLNQPFSDYVHSVHNHGHGDFGFWFDYISHKNLCGPKLNL